MNPVNLCLLILVLMLTAAGCERELAKSSEPPEGAAITNVSARATCVQGDSVGIVVTVENQGDQPQTFEITLTDTTDGKEIGRQLVTLSVAGTGGVDDSVDLILTGEKPGDYFGDYNFTGDVNGDGYDDLLVAGASRYNNNQGRIYLYFGGPDMDGVADIVLTGEHSGDYFGEVAPMGDVNKDGYDDIIVGAPGHDNWRGRVYIYYGGQVVNEKAGLILEGEKTGSWFGRSIAIGDVNGDGYEDVFVVADHYNNLTGRVYLYYGGDPMDTTPDKIFDGQQEGELFGRCLYHQNKIADVDGDGCGDIVISSRNWNETQGRAYLYYGGPSEDMDTIPDVVFTGESLGDDFGVCAALFDIDNDGYADVLIGARKWPAGAMQGRIYLYWGSSRATFDNVPDLTFDGEADATATLGGDCVAVGYVNDDDYADIVATAYDYYRFSGHGRTHLFYGGPKSSIDNVFDWVVTGEEPLNLIMSAVIADFNGDRCGDIAMGGWGYPHHMNQGRVWLYYGQRPSLSDLTFDWNTAEAATGNHTFAVGVSPAMGKERVHGSAKTIIANVSTTVLDRNAAPHEDEPKKQGVSTVSEGGVTPPAGKPVKSLTLAAVDGDMQQVKLHLASGTDINGKTVSGDTALHYAIKYRHRDVAELLITSGADMYGRNRDGETPAHLAIKANQKEVLDLLLAKGATVSPAHLAAYRGDLAAARKAISKTASVNTPDEGDLTLLHAAASGGRKNVVEYLIGKGANLDARDKKKQTPLFCAAASGHREVVALLLAKGADPNPARDPDHWTPLYAAVDAGRQDVVELLADNGGNVNAGAITDDTPLHSAALKNDKSMAELLIRKGAALNARDARYGNTPLHEAVVGGHTEVVQLLTTQGADLNVKNADGFTPLHYAVSTRRLSFWESRIGESSTPNDLAIAELLIAHGADVNAKSDNGATPLSLARKGSKVEIVELLRKHGAKE